MALDDRPRHLAAAIRSAREGQPRGARESTEEALSLREVCTRLGRINARLDALLVQLDRTYPGVFEHLVSRPEERPRPAACDDRGPSSDYWLG